MYLLIVVAILTALSLWQQIRLHAHELRRKEAGLS
jgi:hypothetical protein